MQINLYPIKYSSSNSVNQIQKKYFPFLAFGKSKEDEDRFSISDNSLRPGKGHKLPPLSDEMKQKIIEHYKVNKNVYGAITKFCKENQIQKHQYEQVIKQSGFEIVHGNSERKKEIDDDILQEIIKARKNREIAQRTCERLGITPSQYRTYVKRGNLADNKKIDYEELIPKIKNLREQGKSNKEIAQELGIDIWIVHKIIKLNPDIGRRTLANSNQQNVNLEQSLITSKQKQLELKEAIIRLKQEDPSISAKKMSQLLGVPENMIYITIEKFHDIPRKKRTLSTTTIERIKLLASQGYNQTQIAMILDIQLHRIGYIMKTNNIKVAKEFIGFNNQNSIIQDSKILNRIKEVDAYILKKRLAAQAKKEAAEAQKVKIEQKRLTAKFEAAGLKDGGKSPDKQATQDKEEAEKAKLQEQRKQERLAEKAKLQEQRKQEKLAAQAKKEAEKAEKARIQEQKKQERLAAQAKKEAEKAEKARIQEQRKEERLAAQAKKEAEKAEKAKLQEQRKQEEIKFYTTDIDIYTRTLEHANKILAKETNPLSIAVIKNRIKFLEQKIKDLKDKLYRAENSMQIPKYDTNYKDYSNLSNTEKSNMSDYKQEFQIYVNDIKNSILKIVQQGHISKKRLEEMKTSLTDIITKLKENIKIFSENSTEVKLIKNLINWTQSYIEKIEQKSETIDIQQATSTQKNRVWLDLEDFENKIFGHKKLLNVSLDAGSDKIDIAAINQNLKEAFPKDIVFWIEDYDVINFGQPSEQYVVQYRIYESNDGRKNGYFYTNKKYTIKFSSSRKNAYRVLVEELIKEHKQ